LVGDLQVGGLASALQLGEEVLEPLPHELASGPWELPPSAGSGAGAVLGEGGESAGEDDLFPLGDQEAAVEPELVEADMAAAWSAISRACLLGRGGA
jgi:hypothetical protein